MKNIFVYILLLISLLTVSCVDDDFVVPGGVGDNEVYARIAFGHKNFEKIDITTRATLSEIAESRVENIFVYIFDNTGKRLYSHYYDYSNRVETLPQKVGNYWTVSNRTTTNNSDTRGEVLIKTPELEGGSIYMIVNLNADQLNISSNQLNLIESVSELQALTVTLNQEITSRTGCFLMTGCVKDIDINNKGEISKNGAAVSVPLVRLDAKVSVNVVVGESATANQRMKNFVPESWRVMRLPKGTRVLSGDTHAHELGYFDSEEHNFDTETATEKGFSFYLLENKNTSVGLTSYNQREERHKNVDGTYDLSKGMWKNVSDDATYLVIKGTVQMEVDTDTEQAMQYLEADVTYYVHLGNFGDSKGGGNYNDFTVERNTHYNYTITVKGVKNIEVEVETGVENQPGAIGDVYKSRDEFYTYDAHYGQRVYRINADAVLPDAITWYVKTPFSEGMPGIEGGTQVPNLDYRWVWFMCNKIEANGSYSTHNQWYPGDKYQTVNYDANDPLMNVVEFVELLKQEKYKYNAASDAQKPTASIFRPDENGVYCLYVTVFVDEYFYDKNPLNHAVAPQDLWKQFVNKPNRLLHILSDSHLSKDGDSSLTTNVITVRQRSMQTPYNIENADLKTAWGCETVDEFMTTQLYFYSSNETMYSYDNGSYNLGLIGKTSEVNGLYNSLRMWGITPGTTRWDSYIDYDRDNDYETTVSGHRLKTYFINDNSVNMRYASLMRNRDNNGNGIIDADELRWYIASLNQLYDIYIGQQGLNNDVALYTAEMAAQPNQAYTSGPYTGAYKWRNHVVCSTWKDGETSNAQPQILWAEEGISIGGYFDRYGKYAPMSMRLVRNLGITNPSYNEEGVEGIGYPVPLVQVSDNGKGGYIFNLKNLNEKSLRYYTSRELEIGNENFETSRLYYGFETGATVTRTMVDGVNNKGNYLSLKGDLEAGKETGCDIENGYRVPNVREGALMALYCSSQWWNGQQTMVSTWYSNGDAEIGATGNDIGCYSWQFGYKFASVGNGGINTIRSVRDWRE